MSSFASAPPPAPARVAVGDDDPLITRRIVEYFGDHDIRAVGAAGRQELDRQFAAREPDLVILDRRLGADDGLDLLRDLRARSDVPVIMVTGEGRDEIERVIGL